MRRGQDGGTERTPPCRSKGASQFGIGEASDGLPPGCGSRRRRFQASSSNWGGAWAEAQGSGIEGSWRWSRISRTTGTSVMSREHLALDAARARQDVDGEHPEQERRPGEAWLPRRCHGHL